jgi:DNA processing protein
MDERRACALLARTPGLRAPQLRAAAERLGELSRVAGGHGPAECRAREEAGFSARALAFLRNPPEALTDADLRWLDASGAVLLPCTSPQYPPLLADVTGAPALLWVLGDARVLSGPLIALVGARRATPGGCATAREFAVTFARAGVAVASGLALGIDAAGHAGALAEGTTIAVCAHGLDRVYPPQHADLAARIAERGALVSRFPPATAPRRAHFPARNRDLSAMTACTVVIEAARASGSLLTAHAALQQKRPVFAVPGSVHNPLAAGCHELIRSGGRLVQSAEQVLEELKICGAKQQLAGEGTSRDRCSPGPRTLDKDSEILLDALGFEPVSINTLVERTGLPSGSVASMLLILELRGSVVPLPGGRYCRLP